MRQSEVVWTVMNGGEWGMGMENDTPGLLNKGRKKNPNNNCPTGNRGGSGDYDAAEAPSFPTGEVGGNPELFLTS